jgi:hypothetical protein
MILARIQLMARLDVGSNLSATELQDQLGTSQIMRSNVSIVSGPTEKSGTQLANVHKLSQGQLHHTPLHRETSWLNVIEKERKLRVITLARVQYRESTIWKSS